MQWGSDEETMVLLTSKRLEGVSVVKTFHVYFRWTLVIIRIIVIVGMSVILNSFMV